jgi:hypothetical protein
VIFSVWRSVHQVKKAFSQQQQQYEQQYERQAQQSQQQAHNAEKVEKKRRAIEFLKNKSEDAEYEIISSDRKSSTDDSNNQSSSTSGPHYTDAKYEDVK